MSGKKVVFAVAVIVAVAATVFGISMYRTEDAGKEADAFLHKAIAPIGSAHYAHAERALSGVLTIKGLSIKPTGSNEEYKIDELVVHRFDAKNPIPRFIHITAKGIKIDVDKYPDPRAQLFLKMMGYKELVADLDVDYDYKPKAKTLTLTANQHVKDLGDINFNVNLDDVALKTAMFSYPMIKIKSAKLSYRDASLIDRLLKLFAAQSGTSPEGLVAKIKADIDRKIAQSHDKLQVNVLEQVKNFLDKRGTFTVSVKPQQPVQISELQGMAPNAVADRLNVQVSSN